MKRSIMVLVAAYLGCGDGSPGTASSTGPPSTGGTSEGSGSPGEAGASSRGEGSVGTTLMAPESSDGTGVDDTGPTDGGSEGGTGMPIPAAELCSGTVVETLGMPYADDHPERNRLDLFVPEQGGPCPLLLWVHGGAWQSGNRTLGGAIQARLMRQRDRGYAIGSIGYRLSSDAIFPAQIHDIKAALRWVRAHAAETNIDPNRIALIGASAGGHLVALAGTSGQIADLEDLAQGNGSERSDVQAVIDCYGPTSFDLMDPQLADNGCPPGAQNHTGPMSPESRLLGCAGGLTTCPDDVAHADPITYVDGQDPPFLIGHGTEDCTVPPGQSMALDDALKAAGVPSALHMAEGSGHQLGSCPPDAEIDTFLDDAFGISR